MNEGPSNLQIAQIVTGFILSPELSESELTPELNESFQSARRQITSTLGFDDLQPSDVDELAAVILRALDTYANKWRKLSFAALFDLHGLLGPATKEARRVELLLPTEVGFLKILAQSKFAKEEEVQRELFKAFYFVSLLYLCRCHRVLTKSDQFIDSYADALEMLVLGIDACGQGMKMEAVHAYTQEKRRGGISKALKNVELEAWIESEAPGYWLDDHDRTLRVSDIAQILHRRVVKDPSLVDLDSSRIPKISFFKNRVSNLPDFPAYLSKRGPKPPRIYTS